MRDTIRHFVEICAQHLPIQEPVFEFGAYQVSDAADADLRPIFSGLDYVGADMREGPGVDRILDLHGIDLPDASAGAVLCMDTLEHVEFPRKAMEEIERILRPGGVAVVSSVFDFPIRDHPNDFWRFTPEGLKSLLSSFDHALVFSYGKSEVSPQTVVGVGFKGELPPLSGFIRDMNQWSKWYSGIARKLSQENDPTSPAGTTAGDGSEQG